jgi:hypothetical protein
VREDWSGEEKQSEGDARHAETRGFHRDLQ